MTTSDPVATEKAAELAKAEKIDLAAVEGTGADGLVKIDDVRKAVADRKAVEDADADAEAKAEAKKAEKAKAEAEKKKAAEAESSSSSSSTDTTEPSAAAKKTAAKMPSRAHLEGCPAPDDRVEIYEQHVPPKKLSDGQITEAARTATMAHCVECGATVEI